jgi:hypothetical protein
MSHRLPLRIRVGAALAIVALLVLAGCGDDEDSPTVAGGQSSTTVVPTSAPPRTDPAITTPSTAVSATTTTAGTVLAVTVRGGQVVDGASRQRATLNQPVTVRVTSDRADHLHVHGYDKFADVGPGKAGEVTFVANIPGVFEVELEESRRLLFTLEVR